MLLLVVYMAGCQSFGPAETVLDRLDVVIPVEMINGQPMVQVSINERGPFRFLLDTGSTNVEISEGLARELHLAGYYTVLNQRFPDGRVRRFGKAATIKTLRANGVTFRQVRAVITDFHVFRESGLHFDGILGFSLFQDAVLTVDLPRNQIIVTADGGTRCSMNEGVVLEFSDGAPLIPVCVGTGPACRTEVKVVIDTGYSGLIKLPAAVKDSLTPHRQQLAEKSVSVMHGRMVSQPAFQLKTDIRIGNVRLEDPVVSYENGPGRIGIELLRFCKFTFDQRNQTMSVVWGQGLNSE